MKLIRRQICQYPDHIRSTTSLSHDPSCLISSQLLEISLKPEQRIKIDPNSLVYMNSDSKSLSNQSKSSSFTSFSSFYPSLTLESYMLGLYKIANLFYPPNFSSKLKNLSIFSRKAEDNTVNLLEISNSDQKELLQFALNSQFPNGLSQFDLAELGNLAFFRPDTFLCGEVEVSVDKVLFEIAESPGKCVYMHRVQGAGWFCIKSGNCLKEIYLPKGGFIKISLKALLGFHGDIKLVCNDPEEMNDLGVISVHGPGTVFVQAIDQYSNDIKPTKIPKNLQIVTINNS